jgi:hypothetical protein
MIELIANLFCFGQQIFATCSGPRFDGNRTRFAGAFPARFLQRPRAVYFPAGAALVEVSFSFTATAPLPMRLRR